MFEARLEQASVLKKLFDAIRELCKDVRFDCAESGIALQAMDSSHVSLVALLLKESAFNTYRCDRSMSLGLNIESVVKVFKTCSNDDIVTLKKEDETDVLLISFENPETECYSSFEVKLLDIDCEHFAIPESNYTCVVKMPALEFQKICKDMKEFGETVQVAVDGKDSVSFTVNGDLGRASVTLRKRETVNRDAERVTIAVEEPVTLSFALRYLNSFTRATALSECVCLNLSKDMPLIVAYDINDSPEKGYLHYYLAPKIEELSGA